MKRPGRKNGFFKCEKGRSVASVGRTWGNRMKWGQKGTEAHSFGYTRKKQWNKSARACYSLDVQCPPKVQVSAIGKWWDLLKLKPSGMSLGYWGMSSKEFVGPWYLPSLFACWLMRWEVCSVLCFSSDVLPHQRPTGNQGGSWLWTKTFETISQNKPFLFVS